jgi:hypothetical protein
MVLGQRTYKNSLRIHYVSWLTHFVLLLRHWWPDVCLPTLYRIYIHLNKYFIFCSEFLHFVVGIHAQLSIWQLSHLNYYTTAWPTKFSHLTNIVGCNSFVKCGFLIDHVSSNDGSAVKVLCYRPEGYGSKTRLGEWFLSIYLILLAGLGPGVYSATNRNEYQKQKNNISREYISGRL